MEQYKLEYLDHQPGCYGPAYGDCWRPVTPNRRYTRVCTATGLMTKHATAMTAPAFRNGVTRVIAVNKFGEFIREVDRRNHDPERV